MAKATPPRRKRRETAAVARFETEAWAFTRHAQDLQTRENGASRQRVHGGRRHPRVPPLSAPTAVRAEFTLEAPDPAEGWPKQSRHRRARPISGPDRSPRHGPWQAPPQLPSTDPPRRPRKTRRGRGGGQRHHPTPAAPAAGQARRQGRPPPPARPPIAASRPLRASPEEPRHRVPHAHHVLHGEASRVADPHARRRRSPPPPPATAGFGRRSPRAAGGERGDGWRGRLAAGVRVPPVASRETRGGTRGNFS